MKLICFFLEYINAAGEMELLLLLLLSTIYQQRAAAILPAAVYLFSRNKPFKFTLSLSRSSVGLLVVGLWGRGAISSS